jgi:Zn-dependent protease with chaperone function
MDFFDQQERARKKTGLLILYFVLAVLAIIAAVYVALAVIFRLMNGGGQQLAEISPRSLWDWQLFAAVAGGTTALVAGGSAYRIVSLAAGGHKVAEMMGGQPIAPDTRDPLERRVLNVVEEMAIASGCPVPPVYLLDEEPGINAFAAGHTQSDAVIGVTRGTIERLGRDELQGVIAHEFSHILNGDMRLNIRLMGLLYGILLIGITGWTILRSTNRMAYYSNRRDSDNGRRGVNPLPFIGIALFIIGYVGVFFGHLIKAAVSRQREYLADASAVQFTRNPDGLAGALKKIGALSEGSHIQNPKAEEASHMFFGQAIGLMGAWNPLASHPPLIDRIRRLDSSFDGDFSRVGLEPAGISDVPDEMRRTVQQSRSAIPIPLPGMGAARMAFDPVQAVARVGTVDQANLAYASALLGSLPEPISALVQDKFGACAVIYALLLDRRSDEVRRAQVERLERDSREVVVSGLPEVVGIISRLAPDSRLPIVELALPSLRRLTEPQFREFLENLRHLMEADQEITLFEYAVRRMLLRHLGPQYGWGVRPKTRFDSPEPLAGPTGVLLSALAQLGQSETRNRERAYEQGVRALGWALVIPPAMPSDRATLTHVDEALKVLASASPPLKRQILTGCAACIASDGEITLEERELLRAICDALDCPMPPLGGAGLMA